jgi:DNA-binding transcriptional regulator YiaG
MTFAEQLAAAQDRLGLTQPKLAELLEVSPKTVWNWIKGVETPHQLAQEGALARIEREEAKRKENKK